MKPSRRTRCAPPSPVRRRVAALCLIGGLLGAAAAPALAQAQDYPARPVRVIVPYPPGGATDVIGRVVAQQLGAALGQQFIVDNRAGAGGSLGAGAAAQGAARRLHAAAWAR